MTGPSGVREGLFRNLNGPDRKVTTMEIATAAFQPDAQRLRQLLFDLVSIDSSNPALGEDCPGEREVEEYLLAFLKDRGFETFRQEVHPGRHNILATLPGLERLFDKGCSAEKPVVLFEIHMDTVARSSMEEKYREPVWEGDRLYGRGTCDTKGSLAALLHALEGLKEVPADDLPAWPMLCAAVDEEVGATGADAFIASGIRADAAVVGEPTMLVPCLGHKGAVRFEIETTGKSCHSSKPHLGINAIMSMNRVLSGLAAMEATFHDRAHPLIGEPTLCVGTIHGGTQNNVVPDRCVIEIDRRTVPGEGPGTVFAEIDALLEDLAGEQEDFRYRRSPASLVDLPVFTDTEAPVARAALKASRALLGADADFGVLTCSSDASNLGPKGGIPCVILGPGSLDQAHKCDEYVDFDQVVGCASIYYGIIMSFPAPER